MGKAAVSSRLRPTARISPTSYFGEPIFDLDHSYHVAESVTLL
jgi:hypothetical protein